MKPTTLPLHLRLLALGWLAAVPACSSGGDGDDEPQAPAALLTPKAALLDATGANDFQAESAFETDAGRVLVWDSVSGALVEISSSGAARMFTSAQAIRALTGKSTVGLGPLEQIREGSLRGSFLVADSVSGQMLRIGSSGVPALFSSGAQITFITGQSTFQMILPRELTNEQYVAQDLVTHDVLRFASQGTATPFVSAAVLATAAGVAPAQTTIAQWVRGSGTGSLFLRFSATPNVVKMQITAQTARHVSATTLQVLFPSVTNLRVLDMIAHPQSDALLLLIGSGDRGVAIAEVSSSGQQVTVFMSQDDLQTAAGVGADLSDLVLVATGDVVAIDEVGDQVLLLGNGGVPGVLASKDDIEAATGLGVSAIDLGAGLGTQGLLVPERASDSLVLVR